MTRPIVDPAERMRRWPLLRRFAVDGRGATAIEYALIAGMIFVVIVGGLRLYADKVSGVYQTIGNAITQN